MLTQADIDAIRLQPEELDSYALLAPDEAVDRLIPRLARRVDAALRARRETTPCTWNTASHGMAPNRPGVRPSRTNTEHHWG